MRDLLLARGNQRWRFGRVSMWDAEEYQAHFLELEILLNSDGYPTELGQDVARSILDMTPLKRPSSERDFEWLFWPRYADKLRALLIDSQGCGVFDGGQLLHHHLTPYVSPYEDRPPSPKVPFTGWSRADYMGILTGYDLDPITTLKTLSIQEIQALTDRLAEMRRPEKELWQAETNRDIKEMKANGKLPDLFDILTGGDLSGPGAADTVQSPEKSGASD